MNRIDQWLVEALSGRAIVSIQNSQLVNDLNMLEPDVCIWRPREDFYQFQRPTPEDVLLLIEVADLSLRHDRKVKRPVYAQAGITEHWLVDLKRHAIEVCREPEGEEYAQIRTVRGQGEVSPEAFPDVKNTPAWLTGA